MLPLVLFILTFVYVTHGQIIPGSAPSSPSPIVLACQVEAGVVNVTQKYPEHSYAQVLHTWCSIYEESLACIDRTLPEKKYHSENDWYLSLIYDSAAAKETSDKVCASFPDVAGEVSCLRGKMGNITRFIDLLLNQYIRNVPPLSLIIHKLFQAKLFTNENADNTACVAATHIARVFHENAVLVCSMNVTKLITEYYMILNGKCDHVLNEKPAPPPTPVEKTEVIDLTPEENNSTLNETSDNENATMSQLEFAQRAAQLEEKIVTKLVMRALHHPHMRFLESIGRDGPMKQKLRTVKMLNHVGLAKRMLRILRKLHKKRQRAILIARKKALERELALLLAGLNTTESESVNGTAAASDSALTQNETLSIDAGNKTAEPVKESTPDKSATQGKGTQKETATKADKEIKPIKAEKPVKEQKPDKAAKVKSEKAGKQDKEPKQDKEAKAKSEKAGKSNKEPQQNKAADVKQDKAPKSEKVAKAETKDKTDKKRKK